MSRVPSADERMNCPEDTSQSSRAAKALANQAINSSAGVAQRLDYRRQDVS
jgi:hypothetical protein